MKRKPNSPGIRPLFLLGILIFLSSCQQKAPESEGFRFAFLTDIHLTYEKRAPEAFQSVIRKVNELKPDFVITGGDMIMDALNNPESAALAQYQLYDSLAGQFQMPVYLCKGNHEIFGLHPNSGVDPSHPLYGNKMYEKEMGKRYYAFNHKGWRFYILDSVEKDEHTVYYGHIDSLQMDWLREDLKQVDKETPLVIVTHIPFITVQTQLTNGSTIPNPNSLVVTNSREVLDLFRDYSVKMVLQGHLHFLEDISVSGLHFITGGAVCASWWEGPRNGMEEGFVMVQTKGTECSWEYIDYGWEATQD